MIEHNENNQDLFTVAGTNIDEVKRQNERSGMSYNEVKQWLSQTTGGHGTRIYSDTDIEEVKRKNQNSMGNENKFPL
jgi:Small, acid-soluble spore protein, gamma-type